MTRSRSTGRTSSNISIASRSLVSCFRLPSAIGATAPGARIGAPPPSRHGPTETVCRWRSATAPGSTWEELEVVSWQLTSGEAQDGPLREAFLRLADHIAYQDRRLRRALAPLRPQTKGL